MPSCHSSQPKSNFGKRLVSVNSEIMHAVLFRGGWSKGWKHSKFFNISNFSYFWFNFQISTIFLVFEVGIKTRKEDEIYKKNASECNISISYKTVEKILNYPSNILIIFLI